MKAQAGPPLSRPFAAADRHSARISDHTLQAEAFLGMFSRLRPSGDLDAAFQMWAGTKDFQPRDRRAIAGEVQRLLSAVEAEGEERRP